MANHKPPTEQELDEIDARVESAKPDNPMAPENAVLLAHSFYDLTSLTTEVRRLWEALISISCLISEGVEFMSTQDVHNKILKEICKALKGGE